MEKRSTDMNFIFDIGNVLIDFKPTLFLQQLFPDRSVADQIESIVFKSTEWAKLDQGLMTHEEARDIFCLSEPDFQPEILHTMQRLPDMLRPISSTIALLPSIKEAGHGLYYLSNYHKELRDYLLKTFDFFSLFDGGVFSCDLHVNKPSPEIYRHLLEQYQLSAENCLFFDDMVENVEAARKEGMQSVVFTGAACVRPFLNHFISPRS